MSSEASERPVNIAINHYLNLLETAIKTPKVKLPSERTLARRWGLSQAAVNRAAGHLIAQGRMRRQGYGLYPLPRPAHHLRHSRVVVLTHRDRRFTGIADDAAELGIQLEERFFVGRDSLRQELRTAIDQRIDGVIFRLSDGGWEWDEEAAEMNRLGIPFIVAEVAPQGVAMAAEDWHDAAGQLVSYLASMGHKEMVFVGSLRRAHRSTVVRHAYEERCLRLGLTDSAGRIVELTGHTTAAIEVACGKILQDHANATALVLYDEDHAAEVIAVLLKAGVEIPRQMSIVTVGDGPGIKTLRPAVTAVAFDAVELGHLLLDQVCRMIGQLRTFGKCSARPRLLVGGALQRRASVCPRGSGVKVDDDEGLMNRLSKPWPREKTARMQEAEALRLRPHLSTRGVTPADFVSLDLRSVANRSLTQPQGWLGHLPLLNLPSGRQVIHGVPFDLIDESKNEGKSALVMRSQRSGSGDVSSPVQTSIPVGQAVRAVYFLHGCGFVSVPSPFAWYDFVYKGRKTISLPLVARGLGELPKTSLTANIQDWWSDFPQIEGPGVLPMVVTEDGDPFVYERYIYTLEWESPSPDLILQEIRISSNPAQPTALGVLGISYLKA